MNLREEDIARIVAEVVKKLDFSGIPVSVSGSAEGGGIFDDVATAVEESGKAQEKFHGMGLEKRRKIIDAIRKVSLENARRWAEMAVGETGMGRVEDKTRKNLICATNTPGVEDLHSVSYTGDNGLTLVEYAPFGVVSAITPSTNPVATIISNSIGILAAGNSVVFAPHPASKRCVQDAVKIINSAIVSAGGPINLLTTITEPSQEATKALLTHRTPKLNLVTGGPAIVKVALTAGKICKTIAAGPGNPPVVVDETAVFPECAQNIITGAGFDNNVLCIAEKEVIVVEKAREKFLSAMRSDSRAYELSSSQMEKITSLAITPPEEPGEEPKVNRKFVGKNPSVIAEAAGFNISGDVRVLWSTVENRHPFVMTEQIMPVLPVTFVKDLDDALDLAFEAEGGNHHSAGMYSTDVRNLTKMGRKMACSIFVKNAPTLYGLGLGEGYCSMSIGTPTGDGITKPTHFVRPLQCSLVGYFRIA